MSWKRTVGADCGRARCFFSPFVTVVTIRGAWVVAASAETSIPQRDRVCMVQDTVMNKPAVPVEHDGKTYYGCCNMCKGTIQSDPERYTRATDPVSGKVVDKATTGLASVGEVVYYFESAANREQFADP